MSASAPSQSLRSSPVTARALPEADVLPFSTLRTTKPSRDAHPRWLICGATPAYSTERGSCFCGDSVELMKAMPAGSVDLVITSPPYALEFQKEYGNQSKENYISWFLRYAEQIKRILSDDGSFVLNIGGSYNKGSPTRSLYHFRLLLALCDDLGFHLAQECFWFNPAKLPAPAEWVNVRRVRVKDSVEYVWWLSLNPWPKADNRRVLAEYSRDMIRLIERGYRSKVRPSGHNITQKFLRNHGGAIPTNLISRGNNESNSHYIARSRALGHKVHPARYPAAIPEFFIKFLTEDGQLVLDPFGGSNMSGAVAEALDRRWLAIEIEPQYVENSRLRFAAA
ncbi:MAG TPA: site-specific DNA-methyltransferase [Caulobacteraceae bacterium]|nr:site-specific DNA-methyltransferase [Caulobacteraceae bacterium]